MRLEYLLKDINEEMLKKIQESRPMEEKEAEETAKIVGSVCSQIRRFDPIRLPRIIFLMWSVSLLQKEILVLTSCIRL